MDKIKTILHSMSEIGLIPVFNHIDSTISKAVLETAYRAGVRVFEFTNRESNAIEVFSELKIFSQQFEGLYLGIGTIFSEKDAAEFIENGADFIVSPAFIPSLGEYCNRLNILWIPGCATVSEVYQAKSLGAHLVKAYPGNLLGPNFIKAVHAVMPDVRLMPTGGVEPTEQNLAEWFDAGVWCVGMGSQLFDKNIIASAQYDLLYQKIKNSLQAIQKIRS
jgi:2-dehydro-3-deoxyphosphogluconate aldolase / (4S)-4-hydroxy-2-oxoglutarate aldolase